MTNYTTPTETAQLTRQATPDELWINEQLDRINPERHEMGSNGENGALTILVFEQRRENVKLTGEAGVLKALLDLSRRSLAEIDGEDANEEQMLRGLVAKIDAALKGAP